LLKNVADAGVAECVRSCLCSLSSLASVGEHNDGAMTLGGLYLQCGRDVAMGRAAGPDVGCLPRCRTWANEADGADRSANAGSWRRFGGTAGGTGGQGGCVWGGRARVDLADRGVGS
jgi:hypothetical protein